MSTQNLRDLAIELTIGLTEVCDEISGRLVFVNQLLRAGSSIGANACEAKYAQSRADFVHKMEIALKERYETDYWLEILYRVCAISEEIYNQYKNMNGTIRRKLIASIPTAKAVA